jgi:hypothetical protein
LIDGSRARTGIVRSVLAVGAGGLQQPGDLGQMVDLFASHMGLVQLHRQLGLSWLRILPDQPKGAKRRLSVYIRNLTPADDDTGLAVGGTGKYVHTQVRTVDEVQRLLPLLRRAYALQGT